MVPKTLARYEISVRLGKGGMEEVDHKNLGERKGILCPMRRKVLPFSCILNQFEVRAPLSVLIDSLASVLLGLMLGCGGAPQATLQAPPAPAAPSNLVYPQTTITASVGQPITPDTPTVTGTVTSYAVSPALPAGLSLNTSTGTISGTPTTVAAQASYTVTAANSGGSTTSSVTIAVFQAQSILLELGHASAIQALRFEGNRVLSEDDSEHWALWDYTSGVLLADGDVTPNASPIEMAGQTVVVGFANGLEIRTLSDGHLICIIVYPGLNAPSAAAWWQLASDGSYICIGSQTGLFVFTTTGQTAVSKPGDYSLAKSFAAPGEVFQR